MEGTTLGVNRNMAGNPDRIDIEITITEHSLGPTGGYFSGTIIDKTGGTTQYFSDQYIGAFDSFTPGLAADGGGFFGWGQLNAGQPAGYPDTIEGYLVQNMPSTIPGINQLAPAITSRQMVEPQSKPNWSAIVAQVSDGAAAELRNLTRNGPQPVGSGADVQNLGDHYYNGGATNTITSFDNQFSSYTPPQGNSQEGGIGKTANDVANALTVISGAARVVGAVRAGFDAVKPKPFERRPEAVSTIVYEEVDSNTHQAFLRARGYLPLVQARVGNELAKRSSNNAAQNASGANPTRVDTNPNMIVYSNLPGTSVNNISAPSQSQRPGTFNITLPDWRELGRTRNVQVTFQPIGPPDPGKLELMVRTLRVEAQAAPTFNLDKTQEVR